MNRTASAQNCPCHQPGAHASYTDELDVGITDEGWDITRTTCARCGTAWLRAYRAGEMFPRAGRYFRCAVETWQLERLTTSSALDLIGSSELRLAGGSRYSGVECRVEGPLPALSQKPSPGPNAAVQVTHGTAAASGHHAVRTGHPPAISSRSQRQTLRAAIASANAR